MSRIKLDIPYRSQWAVPDADLAVGDCGPTCVAMLLNGQGNAVTPDDLYLVLYPELKTNPGMAVPNKGYTNFGHLFKAAQAHNLTLKRFTYSPAGALNSLKASLAEGKPSIALVKYTTWRKKTGNNFDGAHFVLVVGSDDDKVYVHDPLFGSAYGTRPENGTYFEWTNDEFKTAWGGFSIEENPNYACLTSEVAFPFKRGSAPPKKPVKPKDTDTPVDQIPLLADLKRRILALAAYENAPVPNLDDPVTLNYWAYHVGKWGAEVTVHVVENGDSLWTVAGSYYGQGSKWRAIAAYNALPNSMIAIGQHLEIPMPGQLDVSDIHDPTVPAVEEMEGAVPLPGHGGPEPAVQ